MKFAILLTSCVRSHDKNYDYYISSIKRWLNDTKLPIFIVESSGYKFPEFNNTRLKVASFNLENEPSSSQYEAKSILFAMETFKDDLKDYTHIIKITGRYFLKVEHILNDLEKKIDVDIILQSKHQHKWNNSEIFGFRIGLEHNLLDPLEHTGLMENNIYNFALSHTSETLPPIPNELMVKRGGDGFIVNPL